MGASNSEAVEWACVICCTNFAYTIAWRWHVGQMHGCAYRQETAATPATNNS